MNYVRAAVEQNLKGVMAVKRNQFRILCYFGGVERQHSKD
jgi:hypothetical protein